MHRGRGIVAALLFALGSLAALSGCGPGPAAEHFGAAENLLGAGDYMGAVEKYSYVVSSFQSSEYAPKSQFRIAVTYDRHLSDSRRALDAYSTLLFLFPESPESARALEEVAGLYSKMGDHDRAAEEFLRLAAERPTDDARLSFKAALEFLEAGDYTRSRRRLTELVEKHPDSAEAPRARYRIAYIHYLEGDTARAVEEYDRLIEAAPLAPLAADAIMGKASALEDAGSLGEALELLEGLRGSYPNEEALEMRLQWIRKRLAEGPGKERR
jgi:TolA-binding protein